MRKSEEALIVYSFPGESRFEIASGRITSTGSSQKSWIMRGFDIESEPIHVQINSSSELEELPKLELSFAPELTEITKIEYEKKLEKCVAFAQRYSGKVVLSRAKKVQGNIDIQSTLQAFRWMYPDSLVYLFHAPAVGTWLGATPEVLLTASDHHCTTYALAGTKWDEGLFTQKEFDEQILVVKDILGRLEDREVEVGDVQESVYGKLRHLKSEMRWVEPDPYLRTSELLHPTAAVNGYPREEATHLIRSIEAHSRDFYTGYLGLLEENSKARLFVNLRCMQLFRDGAILYAGGGINSLSIPDQEWEECERKFNSIEEALEYYD